MSPRLKRKQAEQQSLTPTGMTKAATPERKEREHSPAKLSPEKKKQKESKKVESKSQELDNPKESESVPVEDQPLETQENKNKTADEPQDGLTPKESKKPEKPKEPKEPEVPEDPQVPDADIPENTKESDRDNQSSKTTDTKQVTQDKGERKKDTNDATGDAPMADSTDEARAKSEATKPLKPEDPIVPEDADIPENTKEGDGDNPSSRKADPKQVTQDVDEGKKDTNVATKPPSLSDKIPRKKRSTSGSSTELDGSPPKPKQTEGQDITKPGKSDSKKESAKPEKPKPEKRTVASSSTSSSSNSPSKNDDNTTLLADLARKEEPEI